MKSEVIGAVMIAMGWPKVAVSWLPLDNGDIEIYFRKEGEKSLVVINKDVFEDFPPEVTAQIILRLLNEKE